MPNVNFGWVRQLPDPRDYLFTVPASVTATLPALHDLSDKDDPIPLDQGNLGSCGPNTAAECIVYDELAQLLGGAMASRLFIYYCTRELMGTINQDSGVDNRSMLKALNKWGFPAEALWPYIISNFKVRPLQAIYDAAVLNKITAYATVVQILDQMKGCLFVTQRPFIFGFEVFRQIIGDGAAATGIVRDPGFLESPIGGHDVMVVGYDDAGFGKIPGGAFKFRNSWGNWGDDSYGYIGYPYATNKNLAGDFWCITAVPTVTPPNPPDPPVPPTSPLSPWCSKLQRMVIAARRELTK